MSDATAQVVYLPDVIDQQREDAYLLWSGDADGNAAEVGRRLGIPERTVQHWARVDGWAHHRRAERAALARLAARRAQLAVSEAIPEVVGRLIAIGLVRGDTKTVLDKHGAPVTVELPIPYQAQVNALRTLAHDFGLADAMAALRDEDPEDGASKPERPQTTAEIEAELRALVDRS